MADPEWKAMVDRLKKDGLDTTLISTAAPIQLSGRLASGEPFYFRCRFSHCELTVTDPDQPIDRLEWDHWIWEADLHEWDDYEASYLGPDEAEDALRRLLDRFIHRDDGDDEGDAQSGT